MSRKSGYRFFEKDMRKQRTLEHIPIPGRDVLQQMKRTVACPSMSGEQHDVDRQRVDKWLWHARIVKTRTTAAALVTAGRVRVNGSRVTAPAHALKIGDVVTTALDGRVCVWRVEKFSERRGDADAGRSLYTDLGRR
jgi:ribosome-associated heat shock protein Hsp15